MVILNEVLKSLYKRHRRGYSESELEKLKIERLTPRQSVFLCPYYMRERLSVRTPARFYSCFSLPRLAEQGDK